MFLSVVGCKEQSDLAKSEAEDSVIETPFSWEAATVYFLLTDRFNNGNPQNDINRDRTNETAVLRGFEGGDLKGVTQKIKEGYFNKLGVNAIWMTPIVEQIYQGTDEGTGYTYAYHGYWTKDWTAIEPNFGTAEDLKELVETAHENGIRILLDAVINHTGPVTDIDTQWPERWVRTSPRCVYENYETTTKCTLVENLPDIKTESDEPVDLPPQLVEKWKEEGRYETEVAELDTFFEKTGYPRAPRFYIMKWLSDYITDFGIDGYRVDTVKHTEAYVWEEFEDVCETAFATWKAENPEKVMDDNPFYLVGEIYFYNLQSGKYYDFGDRKEDYFNDSFSAMINFDLKKNDDRSYETIFSSYSEILNTELDGFGTLNYLTSHDDGEPFDKQREKPYETANRLLLAPGAAQIYYGDELARDLTIEGTNGDATLRSFMNWDDFRTNESTQAIYEYWSKLGQFRKAHPAIGAGKHTMISEMPYTFSRTWSHKEYKDAVVISMTNPGPNNISVGAIFEEGASVRDAFSGAISEVKNGEVVIDAAAKIVLLERTEN